jgi:hypothetical protein
VSPLNLTVGQMPVIEILHFLYARLQIKTMQGNKLRRETERSRKKEKILRDGVLLKKGIGVTHKSDSGSNTCT